MPNTLYYGDNLTVLRDNVESESVDLIYLDPPFILFTEKDGSRAARLPSVLVKGHRDNESAK